MRHYLTTARETLKASRDAAEFKARMISAFPAFGGRALLDHQMRFPVPALKGGARMKLVVGFLGVLLLAFSADNPESVETKIARAMSAGPPDIAKTARIVDTDAQGRDDYAARG